MGNIKDSKAIEKLIEETQKNRTELKLAKEKLKGMMPKVFDYTGAPLTSRSEVQGAYTFRIIAKPADAANTPIYAENKIIIEPPADPNALPNDAEQVVYGADLMFIDKAGGDVMNWGEIKANVAAGKVMVIQLISAGTWQLVKWEDKAAAPGGGNVIQWETLDINNLPVFSFENYEYQFKIEEIDFTREWNLFPIGNYYRMGENVLFAVYPTDGTAVEIIRFHHGKFYLNVSFTKTTKWRLIQVERKPKHAIL